MRCDPQREGERHHDLCQRSGSGFERSQDAPPPGAVSGLNMIATRLTRGAISLSICSHLPPSAASTVGEPRDVSTWPRKACHEAGANRITNTIGIVRVSRCSAAVTGVVLAKITSGRSNQQHQRQERTLNGDVAGECAQVPETAAVWASPVVQKLYMFRNR